MLEKLFRPGSKCGGRRMAKVLGWDQVSACQACLNIQYDHGWSSPVLSSSCPMLLIPQIFQKTIYLSFKYVQWSSLHKPIRGEFLRFTSLLRRNSYTTQSYITIPLSCNCIPAVLDNPNSESISTFTLLCTFGTWYVSIRSPTILQNSKHYRSNSFSNCWQNNLLNPTITLIHLF